MISGRETGRGGVESWFTVSIVQKASSSIDICVKTEFSHWSRSRALGRQEEHQVPEQIGGRRE